MGCYGIGVSRTLAMIYEKSIQYNEKKEFNGISLPLNLTPYSIYIIPKLDDEEKTKQSLVVYQQLLQNKVSVLFDDREDLSIGAKIKDSKILGVPYVVVFGKTLDNGYIEVENNLTGEKLIMNVNEFIDNFTKFESCRKNNISMEEFLKTYTK